MSATHQSPRAATIEILEHRGPLTPERLSHLGAYVERRERGILSDHPGWLTALSEGLKCEPFALEAVGSGQTQGLLTLAYLRSLLFGKFLVGLPYLNYGGVLADDPRVAVALVDHAIRLADRLGVRYLELRHEKAVAHPELVPRTPQKVHMRLALPASPIDLWNRLPSKVRNQVRKGEKHGLTVAWGGPELLPEFHDVFSRNMRDLGTPVYGRGLFRAVTEQFPGRSEFCVLRDGHRPIATALLIHGGGTTEVPSAGSLRRYNPTCANMLMYWNLLCRAVERGQCCFDFGRSSPSSNTAKFKAQWGAVPVPAEWQYYVRTGDVSDMRNDSPKYRLMIRLWQKLPVRLTRWIGPPIVRGIP